VLRVDSFRVSFLELEGFIVFCFQNSLAFVKTISGIRKAQYLRKHIHVNSMVVFICRGLEMFILKTVIFVLMLEGIPHYYYSQVSKYGIGGRILCFDISMSPRHLEVITRYFTHTQTQGLYDKMTVPGAPQRNEDLEDP
jgi:hypothetical protein